MIKNSKIRLNLIPGVLLLLLPVWFSFCKSESKNKPPAISQADQRKKRTLESLKQNIGEKFNIDNFVDSSGSSVRLDFKKSEITIIDFWINECPPCNTEMMQFKNLIEGKGKKVSIISISLSSFTAWKSLFLTKNNRYSFLLESVSNWSHLVAKSNQNSKLQNIFSTDRIDELKNHLDVTYFPSYFVVNRDGIIIQRPVSAVEYLSTQL